jgi:hypothetical protein
MRTSAGPEVCWVSQGPLIETLLFGRGEVPVVPVVIVTTLVVLLVNVSVTVVDVFAALASA